MEIKDLITISGLAITLLVGIINLIISLFLAKRQRYISTITQMRGKYIENLREYFALFLSECQNLVKRDKKTANISDLSILNKYFNLILLCLKDDEEFDIDFQSKLNDVYLAMQESNPKTAIKKMEELVSKARKILNIEWQGIKYEAMHGKGFSERIKRQYLKEYLYKNSKNVNPNFQRRYKVIKAKE